MRIKLKPCPFCGSEAKVDKMDNEYRIECSFCFARTWYEETLETAAEKWNARDEEDEEYERVKNENTASNRTLDKR